MLAEVITDLLGKEPLDWFWFGSSSSLLVGPHNDLKDTINLLLCTLKIWHFCKYMSFVTENTFVSWLTQLIWTVSQIYISHWAAPPAFFVSLTRPPASLARFYSFLCERGRGTDSRGQIVAFHHMVAPATQCNLNLTSRSVAYLWPHWIPSACSPARASRFPGKVREKWHSEGIMKRWINVSVILHSKPGACT